MSVYRAEFEAALRAFARASETMKRQGFAAPVLVGGAAVELYSGGAVATGDFDVVTGRQDAFEAALRSQGFTKPEGLGHTRSAGSIPISSSASKWSRQACSMAWSIEKKAG